MSPEDILKKTRDMIREYAEGDPDKWFRANRRVWSALKSEEERSKKEIKRRLIASGQPCEHCDGKFKSKEERVIHRVDGDRGYSDDNCVLMHRKCHEEHHAEHGGRDQGGVLERRSRQHHGRRFLYWWDITPNLAKSLHQYDSVKFVKGDTGARCSVTPDTLKAFLTADRQTSRGEGNWGVKILPGHPDELAFEPGKGGGEWLFLDVVWLPDDED